MWNAIPILISASRGHHCNMSALSCRNSLCNQTLQYSIQSAVLEIQLTFKVSNLTRIYTVLYNFLMISSFLYSGMTAVIIHYINNDSKSTMQQCSAAGLGHEGTRISQSAFTERNCGHTFVAFPHTQTLPLGSRRTFALQCFF